MLPMSISCALVQLTAKQPTAVIKHLIWDALTHCTIFSWSTTCVMGSQPQKVHTETHCREVWGAQGGAETGEHIWAGKVIGRRGLLINWQKEHLANVSVPLLVRGTNFCLINIWAKGGRSIAGECRYDSWVKGRNHFSWKGEDPTPTA